LAYSNLYSAHDSGHGRRCSMPAPLRVSATACALSAAALIVAGWGLAQSESIVERAYSHAFDRIDARGPGVAHVTGGFDPAHMRLSSLPSSAVFGPKLAVGDRITLSQAEGGTVAYEVVEVTPLGLQEPVARGFERSRMKLVTAVTSGQIPLRTVRFLVDAEPQGSTPIERPHAL